MYIIYFFSHLSHFCGYLESIGTCGGREFRQDVLDPDFFGADVDFAQGMVKVEDVEGSPRVTGVIYRL